MYTLIAMKFTLVYNLKLPYYDDALYQVWLNLVSGFKEKVRYVKSLYTDRLTDGQQIITTYGSSELKKT